MGTLFVLAVMGFAIWVIVQAVSERRHPVWARRYEPLKPFVQHLRRDARATFLYLREWPVRVGDRWRLWRFNRAAKRHGLL